MSGGEIEGLNLSGVCAGETDLARALRAEVGKEDRFAADFAAEGSDNFIAEGCSGHAGVPVDVAGFIDHASGFAVDFLSGFEMEARELEVISLDGVVELIGKTGNGTGEETA